MSDHPGVAMPVPPMLSAEYYTQPTLTLAHDLVGKTLWRQTPEGLCGGVIVETEAYISAIDPASHNYRKVSARSAIMFGPPGHAYIYLIYGMYHCLNIVTEPAGASAAVLIRAIAPYHGVEQMRGRCPTTARTTDLARGPGRLCRALGLTLRHNGTALQGPDLWLSETPAHHQVDLTRRATSARIGISQGTDLPWRFFVAGHAAVSGPRRVI